MAYNRMEDFVVAIDPVTGELRSKGRKRRRGNGSYRALVWGATGLLLAFVAVFGAALLVELL